ncbi:MAG: transcriptional regulator [Edaphobacter sp.]|nr:transcriptional regulator [Edaphobacter sp.]
MAYLPGPGRDFGKELWLMDSDGANRQKIAVAETADRPMGSRISPVVWSPSGQRIACIERLGLRAPFPAGLSFSLQTRDANGGDLQVALNDTRLKQALPWVADRRILYVYREDPTSQRSDRGATRSGLTSGLGKLVINNCTHNRSSWRLINPRPPLAPRFRSQASVQPHATPPVSLRPANLLLNTAEWGREKQISSRGHTSPG